MLKEGETVTIADYQGRFVFNPKAPSATVEKDSYLKGHNDGWNSALAFVRAGGLR